MFFSIKNLRYERHDFAFEDCRERKTCMEVKGGVLEDFKDVDCKMLCKYSFSSTCVRQRDICFHRLHTCVRPRDICV